MASSSFVDRVNSLLTAGRLYRDPDDFSMQVGFLMATDQTLALDLVSKMAELAREKQTKEGAPKDYLKKLAKSLDNYQLVSPSWISRNVSALPTPKKKAEQVYDPAKKVVDIRTINNPSFPVQSFILSSTEEDKLLAPAGDDMDVDIGPDPDILLGFPSPAASPVKPKNPSSEALATTSVLSNTTSSNDPVAAVSAQELHIRVANLPSDDPLAAVSAEGLATRGSSMDDPPFAVSAAPTSRKRGVVRSVVYRCTTQQGSASSTDKRTDSGHRVVKHRSPSSTSKRRSSCSTSTGQAAKKPRVSKEQQAKMDRIAETQTRLERVRERNRNTACLVLHCQDEGRGYPKLHAYNHHIPGVFDMRLPLDDGRVLDLRVQALRQATVWLLGRPDDFQRLVELVNMQSLITEKEDNVSHITAEAMATFSQFLNLPVPDKFHISPVNCVAALLHWRCLYIISSLLQPHQHDYWRERFPTPNLEPELPSAIDSHFHLDRLQEYANLRGADVLKILDAGSVAEDRRVQVVGAVANFCDPETYPGTQQMTNFPPELAVAIGYHPKHASRSTHRKNCDLEKMYTLLQDPRVVAIGEIGLDHSVRDSDWHLQNELIRRIKPQIQPHHVVIVHCRGIGGDSGLEAYFLLLHLLKGLPRTQRFQVHCFTGCSFIRNVWLREFPDTYFSYNRGIKSFSPSQKEALVSLDESRLLLETDAPYFPRERERFSAPNQLFDVAEMVANYRQTTTKRVLEVTRVNALRLYQRK